ncbi:MAG: hypothetical protein ACK4RK_16665 [Gemmataceae bacterium]
MNRMENQQDTPSVKVCVVDAAATAAPPPRPARDWLAPFMFLLAFADLMVAACLLHWYIRPNVTAEETMRLFGLHMAFYPIFALERLYRLLTRPADQPLSHHLLVTLVILLAPPVRMGVPSPSRRGEIWLPFLGWSAIDDDLRKRLRHFFSVPMIVMALLILPQLVIEYLWADQMQTNMALVLVIQITSSVIWFAFAFEFIVMCGIAPRKLTYAKDHWVDLAIVLLPVVEFLPLARAARLLRALKPGQIKKLHRAYKLRGIFLKAWKSLLILDFIGRLLGTSPEKRLQQLEELLAERQKEVEAIRREIEAIREEIQRQEQVTASRSEAIPKVSLRFGEEDGK